MIPDHETNTVYVSDLLQEKYPLVVKAFRRLLGRPTQDDPSHEGHLVQGLHADPIGRRAASRSSNTTPIIWGKTPRIARRTVATC